jgi:hypothetical protein
MEIKWLAKSDLLPARNSQRAVAKKGVSLSGRKQKP